MTFSIHDGGSPARDDYPTILDSTIIDVIRATLLRESGLLAPDLGDIAEAHQLAETVIGDVVTELTDGSIVKTQLRASLRDLADLVGSDPETATVEQIRAVALTLRGILDHAMPADASLR